MLDATVHEADMLIIVNSGQRVARAHVICLYRYAEMGFLGINTPEEYGGLGLGHLVSVPPVAHRMLLLPSVASS